MNVVKNIYLILCIFMIIQSIYIESSLQCIEKDTSTGEDVSISFNCCKDTQNKEFIKIDSRYDLVLLHTSGRDSIILKNCVIQGQLHVPKNVYRVILNNTILAGGIKFESGQGIIEKEGYVLLGQVEGGVLKSV